MRRRIGPDLHVWEHAKAHELLIVSKDTDFHERSFVEGFPPKVFWLDVGNAGTGSIERSLRKERERVEVLGPAGRRLSADLSVGASGV